MAFESFSITKTIPASLPKTRELLVTSFASALRAERFQLQSQTDRTIVFTQTYRSFWTWLVTILLFPLGLIAFFAWTNEHNLTVLLSAESESATEVTISGSATRRTADRIRDALSD